MTDILPPAPALAPLAPAAAPPAAALPTSTTSAAPGAAASAAAAGSTDDASAYYYMQLMQRCAQLEGLAQEGQWWKAQAEKREEWWQAEVELALVFIVCAGFGSK